MARNRNPLRRAGNTGAAVTLKRLWNDLAETVPFSLCCGYPVPTLRRHRSPRAIAAMCAEHGAVVADG